MAEPLLTLDTLTDRRTVAIDGAEYELRSIKRLPIMAYHWIGKRAKELEVVMASAAAAGDYTEEQVSLVSRSLDELVARMLDAPDEVRARLDDAQKLAIVDLFSPGLRAGAAAGPAAPEPAQSTGESTSPA